jgi:hypothetical protein
LLVLYGSVDTGLPTSTQNVPAEAGNGIHVQELDGAKVVSDTKPERAPSTAASTSKCVPPTSPRGLAPAIDLAGPTGQAIATVVSSLMPAGAVPIAGLANVDDPGGRLHTLVSGDASTHFVLTTVALEVHLVSPTHAWARYGLQLPGSLIPTDGADAFSNWAELHETNGHWTVTEQSYCVLGSTVGLRCPGTPSYTAVPGAGQQLSSPPPLKTGGN